MRRLDLRRLILGLSILSLLLALAGALYASTVVQRDILLNNSLEDNRAFAQKLARSADIFLRESLGELSYSARLIGADDASPEIVRRELERLKHQSSRFNATAYINAEGVLVDVLPGGGGASWQGHQHHSDGAGTGQPTASCQRSFFSGNWPLGAGLIAAGVQGGRTVWRFCDGRSSSP